MQRAAALQRAARQLAGRLQGAAALSTTSAVQKAKPKPLGDPDEYIFREHCKGTRVLSKEAQETTESLRRADFGSLKPRQRATMPSTPGPAGGGGSGATVGTSQPRTQATSSTSGQGFASASERSTDDAAQELTEKERRGAGGAAAGVL